MFCSAFMAVAFGATFASCSSDKPGAMDDPEPVVKVSEVPNGNFEHDMQQWTVTGNGVSVGNDGCDGSHSLVFSSTSAATASVSQTVSGLADGYYDLEFYAKSSGGDQVAYVDANGLRSAFETSATTWKRHYVRGIEVSGGNINIKVEQINHSGNSTSEVDGLRLMSRDEAQAFIKGGDVSELDYIEAHGATFSDEGKTDDCMRILKNNGMNLVRLRLYNDPGNSAYYPSNTLPKGYQDASDILRLARRAKEQDMQIELTFHYSDYWTNGSDQLKPHAWAGITDLEVLKDSVYQFTKNFLERMNAQGTAPDYVSIGNEIQAGILYDYKPFEPADAADKQIDSTSTASGYCLHMSWLAQLLQSGCKAVREADPDGKIILHLDNAGNKDQYNWFLDEMTDNQVDYDIIGASYYPYFTNRDAKTVCNWAEYVTNRYGKDLIFMEVGYAWNPTLPDGSTGQLANNLPYTDMTKEGQKNFMLELSNAIKNASNQRILGYIYWDPIFIETPGTGWIIGGKNVVSNTTLFDFGGNANPVMEALKYN